MDLNGEVTEWIARWRAGDKRGETEVVHSIYPVVRAIAQQQIGRVGGAVSLQATELAHDALINLMRRRGIEVTDRRHLVALVARIIRCLLVDHLRERDAVKRGAGIDRVSLTEVQDSDQPGDDANPDWLALDDALGTLAALQPEQAMLVELRYFGGLSIEEAAETLGVSRATAVRQWRFARAWLAERLEPAR